MGNSFVPSKRGRLMQREYQMDFYFWDESFEELSYRSAGHPLSIGFDGSAVICRFAQW